MTAPRLATDAQERAIYRPSPAETRVACETLLLAGLAREARKAVREILETMENDHVADRA